MNESLYEDHQDGFEIQVLPKKKINRLVRKL